MIVHRLFLLLFLLLELQSFSQTKKFITVKGKEILGTDGKPFLMKGTNLGNWLVPEGYMFNFSNVNAPRLINESFTELVGPDRAAAFWTEYLNTYITQEDISFIKKTGSNSIRIPFHYKLFTTEDYLGANDPERGFRLIDRVLAYCKKEGLYVMLDMHCAPGGQSGDNIDDSYGYPFLFENERSQELAASIWRRIAAHYKNEPMIIGYDLLNEPIAHFFDVAKLNPLLEPVYKKITKAIRSVDVNHLLFLGGAQWNSNFKIFGQPFDNKLVYSFHKYWTATTQDVIQEYLDFRDKYQVPLYMGESGENKDEWVREFRTLLDQQQIGWHFWPYKKMTSTSGFMHFDPPVQHDQLVAYTVKPKNKFEDIRKAAFVKREEAWQILQALLVNIRFANCKPNNGYLSALGLKPQ